MMDEKAPDEGTEPFERRISNTVEQVLAYQAGDDAVLEELFRRYYPRVLRIVRLRMGPRLRKRMESGDVVQQTFAAALEDLRDARLEGEGALLHWLAVVAENVIRGNADYWGTQKRDPRLEVELERLRSAVSSGEFRVEPAAPEASPLVRVSDRETLEALIECMAELPPDYREVLILRRAAACSVEYTARKMERTSRAIHMLLPRAEAHLSALMLRRGHSVGGA